MSILLEGNLRGIPPADLLQWVGAGGSDAVLVAATGEGYRFRFREGRLIGAVRGNPQQDLQGYLLRSRLSFEQALKVTEAAREQRIPVALAAIRLGFLDDEAREVLYGYLLEVVSDFLRAKEGSFFVATAAQPYLEILAVEAGATELVLEAAHRLDEEGLGSAWRPAPGGSPAAESPDEAIESLLRESARTFESELARASRSSPRPGLAAGLERSIGAARSVPLAPTGALRLVRRPTPDEALFTTELEADVASALADHPQSLLDLRRLPSFAGTGLETIVRELLRGGLVTQAPRSEIFPHRLRWAAAAVAVFLVGLAVTSYPPNEPRTLQASAIPDPSASIASLLEASARRKEASTPAAAPSEPVALADEGEPATLAARPATASAPAADPLREPVAFLPKAAAPAVRERPRKAKAEPPGGTIEIRRTERRTTSASKPRGGRPVELPPTEEPVLIVTIPEPPAAAGIVASSRVPVESRSALPGSLLVNAMPYGFVRIDGQDRGSTPVRLELAAGSYLVEVFRQGYRTEARRVVVTPERTKVEAFALSVDAETEE
jgi:hypothetical protein